MNQKTLRKRLRIAGAGLLAALALGIAGAVYALPSSAAAACPACYGFLEAGHDIYVEKDASEAERAAIVSTIEDARGELEEFWGALEAKPRILVCSDDA